MCFRMKLNAKEGARARTYPFIGTVVNVYEPRFPISGQRPIAYGIAMILAGNRGSRSEEHTSELQSLAYLVCRLLLEKKKPTLAQRHCPAAAASCSNAFRKNVRAHRREMGHVVTADRVCVEQSFFDAGDHAVVDLRAGS